jgi:hypothetical protein
MLSARSLGRVSPSIATRKASPTHACRPHVSAASSWADLGWLWTPRGSHRKPTIAPPSKLHPRTLAACRVGAGCTSGERQPGGSSAITPNGRAISAKAPPRLKRRSRGLGGLSADESADRRTRSRSKTSPASRLDKCSSLHHDRSTCELAHADTQADGEIVGGRRTQCRCAPRMPKCRPNTGNPS